MKSLLIFVAVCLILQTVQCVATGRISISYKDEDPTTGATVDQILQIGESIQANITLSPAPQIPLRFDVVSTMPDVITVSHDVITFNRGQTTGVITLESPTDGKIGVATIIISPQKAGYYIPVTTTILVTGTLSIGLSEDTCVSVNRTTEFTVTISSPAPEGIPLNITASNGVLSTNATEIITGTSSVTFSFTGTTVGSTVITVTSLLFGNATLTFPTQGSIEATNVPTRFLQGAPETILINVNPPASPNNPPVIATRSSNVIVTPTTFVVNPSVNNGSRTVEIIPVNPGFGSVTFASPGYCPLTLDFPVNVSPLCSAGFVPNINADECVVCPGNEQNDGFYFELNTCNNRGTCQYSRCFDNAAVCFCEFPYEGHSCQFNPETDSEIYTSGVLNNETLVLSLEGFAAASGPVNFTAPGNLVRNETGRAFVARYSPEEPFFGAVNPALSPPGNGTFSGISWYWENVCEDNTLIPANFTAAVEVNFPIRPDLLSTITNIQNFYSGIRLYVHRNNTWVPVNQLCAANGINTRVFADLTNFELEASFCQSGQFALFLVPVTPPVPNTGNTNPRNPDADLLPESAGTGKTGFVIPPPKPLPVLPQTVYNASPLNKHLFNDAGSLRASIVALLVAVVVAIIV